MNYVAAPFGHPPLFEEFTISPLWFEFNDNDDISMGEKVTPSNGMYVHYSVQLLLGAPETR